MWDKIWIMFCHFLMSRFSNIILLLHIGLHVKNAFNVQFCHTNSKEEGGREQMMLKEEKNMW
jgi:hypothetical protein